MERPLNRLDLGLRLFNSGQYGEVLRQAEAADAAADVLNLAAAAAVRLGRPDQAEALYRRSISRDPGFAPAHANYGVFLRSRDRVAEAEAELHRAIALAPDLPAVWVNLGNLFRDLDRMDEAERAYLEAVRRAPGHVGATMPLAELLLLQGRYPEAWPLHDTRLGQQEASFPKFPFPRWRGEPISGRSLLIWIDEGFGDEIQFARFPKMLKAMGAGAITLVCRPQLRALFDSLAGVDAVVDARGEVDIPDHDYWTPLLSIPAALRLPLESVPAEASYLASTPERRAAWAARIPAGRPRVGLVWKGNPAHLNDSHRSLPGIETLAPLWRVDQARFVSLQKGAGEDEAARCARPLTVVGPDLRDFADAAAVIDQLDLVISVDTAIAHLAGALGRPCWVLLPATGTDWRWLRHREDSPWYPSLTLIRQARGETWEAVIERVAARLAERAPGQSMA